MAPHERFCLYMPPLTAIGSYKEMVDYAASHGIRKLETLNLLDLSTPNLETAKELKDYADSKGVTFPCVSVGLSLVDDDRKEAIEYAVSMAKEGDIVLFAGKGLGLPGDNSVFHRLHLQKVLIAHL